MVIHTFFPSHNISWYTASCYILLLFLFCSFSSSAALLTPTVLHLLRGVAFTESVRGTYSISWGRTYSDTLCVSTIASTYERTLLRGKRGRFCALQCVVWINKGERVEEGEREEETDTWMVPWTMLTVHTADSILCAETHWSQVRRYRTYWCVLFGGAMWGMGPWSWRDIVWGAVLIERIVVLRYVHH